MKNVYLLIHEKIKAPKQQQQLHKRNQLGSMNGYYNIVMIH